MEAFSSSCGRGQYPREGPAPETPERYDLYTLLTLASNSSFFPPTRGFGFKDRMHLSPSQPAGGQTPKSQIGGGVTTRSSARKVQKPPEQDNTPTPTARMQRSVSRAQQAAASGSASSCRTISPSPTRRLSPSANPKLARLPEALGDDTDADDDDDFFGPQNRNRVPLSQPRFGAAHGALETSNPATSVSNGPPNHPKNNGPVPLSASTGGHLPPGNCAGDESLAPTHNLRHTSSSLPSFLHPLPTSIPEGFDTIAAGLPAPDEETGSQCKYSIDGDEEDFDASPSRQRAGRIPQDHKEIFDSGFEEIDAIFSRIQAATGRTIENVHNHYLATKGLTRAKRNTWNKYQRYFAKFRVEERIACGNPFAECAEAFLHFQTRFANWRDILEQADEIITQEAACGSGYRRRTAFNQLVQKIKALARTSHQTHGFQMFTLVMGNQPNSDQNLFFIIESPGAEGFIGEKEHDAPCAMYASDLMGSFRAHIGTLANKAHVANFRTQHELTAGLGSGEGLSHTKQSRPPSSPTRKVLHVEDKQGQATSPKAKARSASVLSNVSTSDGNDAQLRFTIRDFFHKQLGIIGVKMSASALPWKKMRDTVAGHGAVILNYPDVPFPDSSPDPTYTGSAKTEGQTGETGIRRIGIRAMRQLAQRCTTGEGGIRFLLHSKSVIKQNHVPWIVGTIPEGKTAPVRCLYYNGSAKWVPRQLLPAEWISTVKHESPQTPKAPPRELTPYPDSPDSFAPPPITQPFEHITCSDSAQTPTSQPTNQHTRSPTPTKTVEDTTHSSKPVPLFANLHSHPRARLVGPPAASSEKTADPTALQPTTETSALVNNLVQAPLSQSTVQSPILPSKRPLEDIGSPSVLSKRLKSVSPIHPQPNALAVPPAPLDHDTSRVPSPLIDTSFGNARTPSVVDAPLQHPTVASPGAPLDQENRYSQSRNDVLDGAHLATSLDPINPSINTTMPDTSGGQPPSSIYQGSYAPPPSWQGGYSGYPPYGHHAYFPPPQYGYPDARHHYYQQELQREGAGASGASAQPGPPPNGYPFPPLEVGLGPHRPSPAPPFNYGRPDGPVYHHPFDPRYGSVPPAGLEHQYGHPSSFPPAHAPSSGPHHLPSNMPPPSG
ncbi:hypothetical protein BKA70DRAFT_1427658 [Coprinopsis sp. MPI-PUGE-AT-0042]|nr:hypothetical protein BKA70DRAFT_1427658 [Coprinopsis sp. MPI-PUGE-AT-0042]